jgi:hypothetical protein
MAAPFSLAGGDVPQPGTALTSLDAASPGDKDMWLSPVGFELRSTAGVGAPLP